MHVASSREPIHDLYSASLPYSNARSNPAPLTMRIQSDEIDSIAKGVGAPHTIREEKLHDRGEDCLLLFGPRNRLDVDLPALEKLDEADALDVFRGEAFVRIGADEFE
jgi:hypothetical protein